MVRASSFVSILLICLSNSLFAQFVQGPYSASQSDILPQAGSSQSWRMSEFSTTSDNQWSITADSLVQGEYSDYLVVTDFGFTLPSNAVIYGIEVELECHRSSGNIKNFRSRLMKDGNLSSVDVIANGLWPRPNDDIYTHGDANDTWGEYWTASDINASNFGYAMAIDMTSNDGKNHTAMVDDIRIKIYYDVALQAPPMLPIKAQLTKSGIFLQWEGKELAPNSTLTLEKAMTAGQFYPIYQERLPNDTIAWGQFSWVDSVSAYGQIPNFAYRICYQAPGQDKYYSPALSMQASQSNSLSMNILPAHGEHLNVRFSTYDAQSPILLCVLNAEGRKLHEEMLQTRWGTGEHKLNTRAWSPGIYYLQLSQEGSIQTEKVVIR